MYLPEREIINLWQRQPGQRTLVDSEGAPVQIIYPGRPNDGRGADFRDAVVTSEGERRLGHIEVHSKVSGWQSHGHDRDPVYNQVVLHVVWEQDRPGKTVLQNGMSVPTVILEKQYELDTEASPSVVDLPCRETGIRGRREEVLAILEQAGNARFAGKAARFKAELSRIEGRESLYRGFLEALGYAKNKTPFLELAVRAPLRLLEQVAGEENTGEDSLTKVMAVLLETAGLLSSGNLGRYVSREQLRKIKASMPSLPGSDDCAYPRWELFKVRPGNHPVARILAFSQLFMRFRRTGLPEALLDLIQDTPLSESQSKLEAALVVNNSSCQVFLGRERAAAIIINVLLPFSDAWSQRTAGSAPGKALEIFSRYRRLELNSVERHMADQLGLSSREISSARRQQGLIHLYKTLCTLGKCGDCPLS